MPFLQDSLRQQDWKIERIARDNRALELQNTELRSQLQEVKTENLEVSEKILLLDEEVCPLPDTCTQQRGGHIPLL